MRRAATGVLLALACWLSACASAPRRPASVEDYFFPTLPAGELDAREARRLREGWDDLLSGRAAAAERGFERLSRSRPRSAAAATALAFARLRLGRVELAAAGFDAVLAERAEYVPALAGAGATALRRDKVDAALAFYRRAAQLEPLDARLQSRLADVKLRVTERAVTAARELLGREELEPALEQYRSALDAAPELGGVRLELAELLVKLDRRPEAIQLLEADQASERALMLRLGELCEELRDFPAALQAYERALRRDPRDGELARRAAGARAALELSAMPEEYRRIFDAGRLTRAELAALIDVKVGALERLTPGQPEVAVDISGSWARDHILRVLSLGLMDVYPNHTFQPGALVRRGDLAVSVARILDLLGWPPAAAPALTDMSRANLFHPAASRVVAAGLMDLTPSGAFEPWRPVSGRDAADLLEALARRSRP